jgi:hypothetical protein
MNTLPKTHFPLTMTRGRGGERMPSVSKVDVPFANSRTHNDSHGIIIDIFPYSGIDVIRGIGI